MTGLSTIAATLLGGLSLTLAPIPPEAKPDPYGRGYLGVWFEGSSLSIDRVEPNMPGAKAGVRKGDRILRVNSLQAESTDQVIAHVCSFRPGAVIEMEVQRGSERKVFRIKLGVRPPDNEMRTPLPLPTSPFDK